MRSNGLMRKVRKGRADNSNHDILIGGESMFIKGLSIFLVAFGITAIVVWFVFRRRGNERLEQIRKDRPLEAFLFHLYQIIGLMVSILFLILGLYLLFIK